MKRLIVLTALLQLCVMLEAKDISSKERVDVLVTKEWHARPPYFASSSRSWATSCGTPTAPRSLI